MVRKGIDLAFCASIAIFGIWYLVTAFSFPTPGGSQVGAGYFPAILGAILVPLCIWAFVDILKERAPTERSKTMYKRIFGTLLLSALFIAVWQMFDFFYLSLTIYLFATFLYLRQEWSIKAVALAVAFTVGTGLGVYLIFELALNIRLG